MNVEREDNVSEQADEVLAREVRDAAQRLNEAITRAAKHGLTVELDRVDATVFGDARPVEHVHARVSRVQAL